MTLLKQTSLCLSLLNRVVARLFEKSLQPPKNLPVYHMEATVLSKKLSSPTLRKSTFILLLLCKDYHLFKTGSSVMY